MDPATLASVKVEVNASAALIGDFIGALDPQLLPFILIGKGVAAMAPDLVQDAENIIAGLKSGNDPVQADNDALAAKIASLGTPETL